MRYKKTLSFFVAIAFVASLFVIMIPSVRATDTLVWAGPPTTYCTSAYNTINTNTTTPTSGQQTGFSQTFLTPNAGVTYNLTSANFYLAKTGSPTGTIYAKLFVSSAAWGSNGNPTGSALATSNGVDISTLPTSIGWVTFTFSTPYTMSANTAYALEVGYCATDLSPVNVNYAWANTNSTTNSAYGNVALDRGSYITLGWYSPLQVYGVDSSLPAPTPIPYYPYSFVGVPNANISSICGVPIGNVTSVMGIP